MAQKARRVFMPRVLRRDRSETMALVFSDHAREFREWSEGYAFVDCPGAPGLLFRCPACATDLHFHCYGPGEISLWEDPELEDAPAS